MFKKIIVVSVFVLFAALAGGCDGGSGGGSGSGTVSGTLTFTDALSDPLVGSIHYYVAVMTASQYASWGQSGDPSSYVTADKEGDFTSADSANSCDYSITGVAAGSYYVFAYGWYSSDPSSENPDYAGFGHLISGPGNLTDGGTLDVDIPVSPNVAK